MNQPKTYRLLALDIDGTLVLEHTNTVSEPVKKAIEAIKDKVTVALVSARAWKDQKIILDQLSLPPGYHVLENGTKIMNPNGKLAYTLFLSSSEIHKIVELTRNSCESIGYCVEGQWLQTYASDQPDSVTTLSLIAERDKAEAIPGILDQLRTQYSITVGNHWSNAAWGVVLISHKEASKGGGLRYIQEQLGILPSETIAVGDGASDVPMMQFAEVKIAMDNAEQKMKDVATHVVPSVAEDGIVQVIDQFILKHNDG